jgi:hypothetical protein
MTKLTFKEKVESGQFDIRTMNAMIIQFENQLNDKEVKVVNKPELRAKINVVKDYLRKISSSPPIPTVDETLGGNTHKATSKTITLNTDKKITHDRSITDAGVARKFLQVEDSARKRGIEFRLNLTTVKNLMKAKKCKYTGLPYDYTDPERSPTFDRLDPNKGYIRGNVVSCMKCTNDLKNILIEHPVSVFKNNPTLLLKAVEQWILPEQGGDNA